MKSIRTQPSFLPLNPTRWLGFPVATLVILASPLSWAAVEPTPTEGEGQGVVVPSTSKTNSAAWHNVGYLVPPSGLLFVQAVGCTWAACDYKDPDLMGCTADAKVGRTAFLVNDWFQYVGKIEGMYSPACGSQWTRVTNWAGYNATLKAAQLQNGYLYGLRQVDNRPYGSYINSKMMSAGYFMSAYGESGPPWYSAFTNGY